MTGVDMDDLLDLERRLESRARKVDDDLEEIQHKFPMQIENLRGAFFDMIKVMKTQAVAIRGLIASIEELGETIDELKSTKQSKHKRDL